MGNQHTGAPVLKGGLLQRYQLQARVCGSIAPRPSRARGCSMRLPLPALPAPALGSFVRLPPPREPHQRRLRSSSPSLFANIYIKLPRSPGEAARPEVMREPRCFIYPSPFAGFDLGACFSCCPAGFSSAALGQSVLSPTNLEIISSLAVPSSPQCWSRAAALAVSPPRYSSCWWWDLSVCLLRIRIE